MYKQFYGFRELPFDLTPNPRFLVVTKTHREVLSNLQYGLSARKGIIVIVGEAGTGKTTLVRAALSAEIQGAAHYVYLNNPTLTRSEFYGLLASGFGLSREAAGSKAVFLLELERLLLKRHEHSVSSLVIDEAQSLPRDLLEEVRLLVNIETPTAKLLNVVLVGQPELAKRLNDPSLSQLKQRVALRCELRALDLQETAAYMAARLRHAGGEPARIFTREAVFVVFERSGGIPRLIGVICDNALVTGFATNTRPIGEDLIRDVCRDFDLLGEPAGGSAALEIASALGASPLSAAEPDLAESPAADNDTSLFSNLHSRRRFSLFRGTGR